MASEYTQGRSQAERVTRVLTAFVDLPGETHTLKAIAASAGLHPAVVHRILGIVMRMGWVEQPEPRGPYRLGAHAAHFGVGALASWYEQVDPHQALVDLQTECGGFVFYYTRGLVGPRPRRFCTDFAAGGQSIDIFGLSAQAIFTTGVSLRTGASGRVLLAYAPEELLARALEEPVPEMAGPGAMTDAEVKASLRQVRAQGYAVGRQECVAGWDSVAVPTFSGDSALGVVLFFQATGSVPGDITDYVARVQRAAHLISLSAGLNIPTPYLAA
ncbi:IclR family transcriptional regulator C-terminal domain-containing protein [Streptomyces sp. NPDC050095]|uniref:IclR family transcriptional regulator n=1 Tax=unclassified Streptomyces TaxID=2593676 RepID=UPI003445718E